MRSYIGDRHTGHIANIGLAHIGGIPISCCAMTAVNEHNPIIIHRSNSISTITIVSYGIDFVTTWLGVIWENTGIPQGKSVIIYHIVMRSFCHMVKTAVIRCQVFDLLDPIFIPCSFLIGFVFINHGCQIGSRSNWEATVENIWHKLSFVIHGEILQIGSIAAGCAHRVIGQTTDRIAGNVIAYQ